MFIANQLNVILVETDLEFLLLSKPFFIIPHPHLHVKVIYMYLSPWV